MARVDRVNLLTSGNERPWPLGTAEQGIDAGCAGANVEADELVPRLIVRGGVEQALEPEYVVVPVGNLRSCRAGQPGRISVSIWCGGQERALTGGQSLSPGRSILVSKWTFRRVLVSCLTAAGSVKSSWWLGLRLRACQRRWLQHARVLSVIPHGFEVDILQRQTIEVGLFRVETAVVLVSPA